MTKLDGKIVVTGAAGFIGSNLVQILDQNGFKNIHIIVDHINDERKKKNIHPSIYKKYLDKNVFLDHLDEIRDAEIIIHLGACSDTTIQDEEYFKKNNIEYSKKIFDFCVHNKIRLIYASSAGTYGDGSNGFDDNCRSLKPLSFYAQSKYLFDEFVLDNPKKPPQWVGLKFFNVYGPNEDHKGKGASMVFHGFNQIMKDGKASLFKSYKAGYQDGGQKRDFIYVKDIVDVIIFFVNHPEHHGIFNVGTGKARTFLDLSKAIFKALEIGPNIEFIEMPESLKGQYQYFTEAKMDKLRKIGYTKPFTELEEGVRDYVQNYLK